MRLGEAYVNIRADLKPYYRDLQVGLRETTAKFEATLNKELGRRFGKEISEGARESLTAGSKKISDELSKQFESSGQDGRRRLRRGTGQGVREGFLDAFKSGASLFTLIASSLASALDDGISALPMEVKAALVAGLLAASPFIIAQLGAVVGAGIALGVGVLGIALASQLKPVQDAFTDILTRVRNAAAGSAGPLIDPLLRSLETFANFVEDRIAPRLESIFTRIGPSIERLLSSLSIAVDEVFKGIEAEGDGVAGFIDELSNAVVFLGVVIGNSFRVLLSTGRQGREALRDLVILIGATVLGVSALAAGLAEVYGFLRDISFVARGDFLGLAQQRILDAAEEQRRATFVQAGAYDYLVVKTDAETKALEEQTKAIDENRNALQKNLDAAYNFVDAQIAMEESRDRLAESVKEYGNTLDIDTEKGRENATNVRRFLDDIQVALEERVAKGEITAEQAETQYAREVAALEKVFGKTREGKADFDRLYGSIIAAAKAKLDPTPWVTAFNKIGSAVQKAIDRIRELQRLARNPGPGFAPGSPSPSGGGGGSAYANGGRITKPTLAMMGEGGRPELVLPESDPRRAAEILADSTLSGLLNGGPQVINVYVGNEQLDSRMVRVAAGVNKRTARTLSQVPRNI